MNELEIAYKNAVKACRKHEDMLKSELQKIKEERIKRDYIPLQLNQIKYSGWYFVIFNKEKDSFFDDVFCSKFDEIKIIKFDDKIWYNNNYEKISEERLKLEAKFFVGPINFAASL